MRAKDVVARIVALKRNEGELPDEFADRQAAVLLECGLVKFRANVSTRWPSGRAHVRAVVSLRREFTEWGMAVQRLGGFGWMRPTVGTVVFDTILREMEKQATGGEFLTKFVVSASVNPDILRMGV